MDIMFFNLADQRSGSGSPRPLPTAAKEKARVRPLLSSPTIDSRPTPTLRLTTRTTSRPRATRPPPSTSTQMAGLQSFFIPKSAPGATPPLSKEGFPPQDLASDDPRPSSSRAPSPVSDLPVVLPHRPNPSPAISLLLPPSPTSQHQTAPPNPPHHHPLDRTAGVGSLVTLHKEAVEDCRRRD